jgi:PKD repeat protein/lysophospholipase L1-like esterase
MTRRGPALSIALTLLLGALVPAAAAAAGPTLPFPDTMAAVGDSITQAASSAGSLGADAPQNSWSTGTSTTVNSHYLRLVAAGAPISGQNHNRSVSGAKMIGLQAQMATLATLDPDYLTVLIGGNDICTPTEAQMTSVADFRAQFQAAMASLRAGSPATSVYVVSIPRVYGLYELFRGNWWARFIWSIGGVCQSLLANPTSTNQADVDRRARVDQRNRDFNQVLAEVCAGAAAQPCLWDGGAAFNTAFVASDVSGDYFHPSVAGQAKLSAVSWANGYTWTAAPPPNQPPFASFSASCSGLTCDFTNTSTDGDGTITHAWSFGDGATSTEASPSHTYAAAGPYSVNLTVTDDDLATDSETQPVTVSAPPTNAPPTASFTPSCNGLTCTFTNTSTDDGTMTHAWSFGDGTSSTDVSPSHSYGAGGTFTVALTVTDDDLATATTSQSVTVTGPTMSVQNLTATAGNVNNKFWRATVTISIRDGTGAAVPNAVVSGGWTVGAADTCTTGASGTCTVTSDNLNRRTVSSVTFSVTGVARAGYTYTPATNAVTSVSVLRPQ